MSERKTGIAVGRVRSTTARGCRERVVVERRKGEGWRQIAGRAGRPSASAAAGSTRRGCAGAPPLERSVLVREVEDAFAGYDVVIEELAMLSMTTRSDCARVAAIKGAHQRARVQARS
jgi:hypothetical protein